MMLEYSLYMQLTLTKLLVMPTDSREEEFTLTCILSNPCSRDCHNNIIVYINTHVHNVYSPSAYL